MSLLWVWALLLFPKVVAGDICASERYTDAGECCEQCPPGTRVAVECGKEKTQCEPCQEGLTYSSSRNSTQCLPCGRCRQGVTVLAACTATQNTMCGCSPNTYPWRENNTTKLCLTCTLCTRGKGVSRECGEHGNTECTRCEAGVSFNEEPRTLKACTPCTRCQANEVELRACEPHSDTICMDKQLHINTRPVLSDGTSRKPAAGEAEDTGASPQPPQSGIPRHTPHEEERAGSNILVYVSVLAAVVLGLLLYVAYKCWRSCQQKQALGKARAAELNNAPEGEKLHSDSGVFLDSHSLQDTQPSKGSKRDSKQDSRLYVNLPPHRKEEVERALGEGWRALAEALGYEQERTDMFGRGEDPVHTLLSDWAQQEGATLGLLCSALARIERPDVVTTLTSPVQGVSVV